MLQVRNDVGLYCGRGKGDEEEGTGLRDIGDSQMTLKFPGGVTATDSDRKQEKEHI